MNELEKPNGNKTIIKWLFWAGRGDGSCPSQYTQLPTLSCASRWSWCPLFENDRISPWLTQAEKEGIERVLDISKNPINSRTAEPLKGQGSQCLWGCRQQEQREMSILVSLDSSLQFQGEKVWPASPGFCTSNRGEQSPLISRRPS